MSRSEKVEKAIEKFRAKHNGPALTSHAKRVSVTIHIRNGDGNFLKKWTGHWFDAGNGEQISEAAVRSFLDALEHQSPVLKSDQTYPHRD